MLDGWDVAGWTYQAHGAGGAFHDWFCLPDGLLAFAVGRTKGEGVAAAITANAVKSSLRAHSQYHREADRVLQQLNLTLWTSSAGDQYANLFLGLVETATGSVCCSSAGRPSAMLLRPDGWESLSHPSQYLGESPETCFEQYGYELQPGEAIILFSDGCCDAESRRGRLLSDADVAKVLIGKLKLTAEELAAAVRQLLEAHGPDASNRDRAVVVIKRTN
jgi:serine phosphatase RsbU (regulator of sigma subunit)